ncbi:MAG: septum formation inhibitor Maf [Bacteroidetes bacterium]|nr:septum formation inhibitor Maf [Bacteroidota bacterium]
MNKLTGFLFLGVVVFFSCSNENNTPASTGPLVSDEAKNYWYNGQAEITSFSLQQARYGELREGNAVMIFVTEDFSPTEYTKADKSKKETVPVLKLNFTKNFVTGIYPYSIMTSSFVPFENFDHALKISTSVQEWCGHVYIELLRKKFYNYVINSYFENENVIDGELKITWLEDELWNLIRIFPESIPQGTQQVIPAFSYTRLLHQELKAYECQITTTPSDSGETILELTYPELERTLKITYQTEFPRQIIRWEESYPDGFGDDKKMLTTKGERIKTIRSDYWSKNKTTDAHLRRELGLE